MPRGSQSRSRTVADVIALLERTAADALNLELSEGRCRTITALAGQALAALEQGPLEERLAALEATLATQRGPKWVA